MQIRIVNFNDLIRSCYQGIKQLTPFIYLELLDFEDIKKILLPYVCFQRVQEKTCREFDQTL